MKISWPKGKKFAFTFCDDTDFATLENIRPIYDFINDLGMRTTKLVWVYKNNGTDHNDAQTCEDRQYLDWLLSIQKQGFEIGIHNVRSATSSRKAIIRGIDCFRELFGDYPKLHCNHAECIDNIYWGDARLTGWRRWLYNFIFLKNKKKIVYQGHVKGSKAFWGDICHEKITYVRNFTFDATNTLRLCSMMPYHDPRKPYVKYWFSATNGPSPEYFKKNFSRTKIDQLVVEGGLCIVYTHFGAGFYRNNQIDDHLKKILEYTVSKDGWFAPVSEILDYLRKERGGEKAYEISRFDLLKLEIMWMLGKIGKTPGL